MAALNVLSKKARTLILAYIRENCPQGTRVKAIRMNNIKAPPAGTLGTVIRVTANGKLLVKWDNGIRYGIVLGEETYVKVESPEEREKRKRKNMAKLVPYFKKQYPKGARVELVEMNDVQAPPVGTQGTVTGVDDIGTIHVQWDNGSHLGVVFGKDTCKLLGEKQNVKKS